MSKVKKFKLHRPKRDDTETKKERERRKNRRAEKEEGRYSR